LHDESAPFVWRKRHENTPEYVVLWHFTAKKYAHFHLQMRICRCIRMLRLHAICAVFMGRYFCINKKGVLWASAKIKKQVIWLMAWQIV